MYLYIVGTMSKPVQIISNCEIARAHLAHSLGKSSSPSSYFQDGSQWGKPP